jgi:hypothetical protein
MTTSKTVRAPANQDGGVPVIVHAQQLDRTRELPAINTAAPEGERDGLDAAATPHEIADGDITVPVQSSIESTLTFEVLRRQSIEADEDEGEP